MNGLCQCGCGEPAPIAVKTDTRKGCIKGQPRKFIAGHRQRMALSGKASSLVQDWTGTTSEITEHEIVQLRETDDLEAADIYTCRARFIERSTRRSFVELGLICLEVDNRGLWKKVVDPSTERYFTSLDGWIYNVLNVSRSGAYSAMKVLQMKGVSVEDIRQMPRVNAVKLSKLSTQVQSDPEMIEAAKVSSEKEFTEIVKKKHPGQHIENTKTIIAKPLESTRTLMDITFKAVQFVYEVQSREEVLEMLCAYFMDGKCEREGYTNWTNREAFDAAQNRGIA